MAAPAFHFCFTAMNTRLSLVLPGTGTRAGNAVAQAVRQSVDQQETLMSRFRDGPLARLNVEAALTTCRVPPPLWDILSECRRHAHLTGGRFDVAQGTPKAVDYVEFDDEAQTIRFDHPDVYLDLGGIGKGMALKDVDAILKRHAVTQAFVSFGESSLLALGEHPAGGGWEVSLSDGSDTNLCLIDEAMSVSAQTSGHRHIKDPRTGAWAPTRTVAIAGPCPAAAEALSTALCVAEPEQHDPILARYPHMRGFVKSSAGGVNPAYA